MTQDAVLDSHPSPAGTGLLLLPGAWQNWGGAPAGSVVRLDPGAGELVLEGSGRELRLLMAGGGVPALLHAALALHAGVPAASWPGNAGGSVVKAPAVLLSGRDRPGTAAARTVENAVQHFLANLPAVFAGDVEAVHQLRIAIRRLRTVLVLFKPFLPEDAATDELDTVLRSLGRSLGAARDWDVFCLEILPGVAAAVDADALAPAAGEHRRAAQAQSARDLSDEVLLRFARAAASWSADVAQAGDAQTGADGRLEDAAPALLTRLEHKVRRRGRHMAALGVAELHALRRANKKLRYGVEYLRPLFPRKRVKPFLRACERLGQSLGEVNDAANAAAMLASLAADRPGLDEAVQATAGTVARRRRDAAARAQSDWRTWKAAEPFWT